MSALGSLLTHRATVRGAQIIIGVLMAWAALAKMGDLTTFARQVHNFRIPLAGGENLVAMSLPWIELIASLSLLLGVRARSGAVVSAALLSIFTLAVIAAVARGLDIECGCFGTSDASRVGIAEVLRDLSMLAVAGVACLRPHGSAFETGDLRRERALA